MTGATDPAAAGAPVWRLVAGREISVKLRDKTFVGGIVVMLVLVVGGIAAVGIFGDRPETHTLVVVDRGGSQVAAVAESIMQEQDPGIKIETSRRDSPAQARRAVRADTVDAALLPTTQGYTVLGRDGVDASLRSALAAAVSANGLATNAESAGVALDALLADTQLSQRLLDPDAENAGVATAAAVFGAVLFYLTALTFGITISQSVVQEKESRVVEILAAAVPLRAMLWGKILGNSVLALGQVVLLVAVGLGGLAAIGRGSAVGGLGPAAAWYVVFFALGFVALASFWSVAGALATRQEDLQVTTLPGQALLLVPYLLTVTGGDRVREVLSMVPIVSAMTMPGRIAEGGVPPWQIATALVLTVLAAVALVRLGSRMYARTLLQTSRRTTYRDALRAQG